MEKKNPQTNQPEKPVKPENEAQVGEESKIAGKNPDSGNADAVNEDGSITRNSGNPNH